MRMNAQASRAVVKPPMSAAGKITRMVTDFFLPMVDGFIPAYTPFTSTPDAEELLVLERLASLFPESMRTRGEFVQCMGDLYDRSVCGGEAGRADEKQTDAGEGEGGP